VNRLFFLVLAVVAWTAASSSVSSAQSSLEVSQLPSKPDPHVEKRVPASWLALTLAGQAAALADVKTTLTLRNGNPGFADEDPFARAIVNLPTPAYVAVAAAFTSVISVAGYEMRKSSHRWERRMWWIPQTVQIAINTGCSIHNAREPDWAAAAQRRKR
jgi:hypothetical protein